MSYIPSALRETVRLRARLRCEYCLFPEQFSGSPHEIDHIIAEKHEGLTDIDNLCLACIDCNRFKGSDLCSLDLISGEVVRIFDPRRNQWQEHFALDRAYILPRSAVGRVTVQLLRMNNEDRVSERQDLLRFGGYSAP